MFQIGLSHYLIVAAILFTIGVFGIFLNRKNVIISLSFSIVVAILFERKIQDEPGRKATLLVNHLLERKRALGETFQAGIGHARDVRALLKKGGNLHRTFLLVDQTRCQSR